DGFFVLDVLVGEFLQAGLSEHADEAFMENVISGGWRNSVTRNQSVWKKSDRGSALVADIIIDREQILVVDRNGAPEFESFTVVVGQSNRAADAESSGPHLLPNGLEGRQLGVRPGSARPAELRIERITSTRRGQQNDRRRFRVRRLAEFDQRQVVDAAAFQSNCNLQSVRGDGNAWR